MRSDVRQIVLRILVAFAAIAVTANQATGAMVGLGQARGTSCEASDIGAVHRSSIAKADRTLSAEAATSLTQTQADLAGTTGGAYPEAVGERESSYISPPEPPSSFALVLGALASFGAFEGLRSLRKVGGITAPGWYFSDGRGQIAHATAIDPDCLSLALAPCVFGGRVAVTDDVPGLMAAASITWRPGSSATPWMMTARGPPQ